MIFHLLEYINEEFKDLTIIIQFKPIFQILNFDNNYCLENIIKHMGVCISLIEQYTRH